MSEPTTILIADDEAHIVYILEGKLADAGYRVLVARDGEEATALAIEHGPALAITDLNMPGTDGLAFSKAIHADPKTAHIPVIMLTGRGHTLPEEERQQTNIQHLESKPFSARRMLGLVQSILGPAQAA